jgi:hypothetical protein
MAMKGHRHTGIRKPVIVFACSLGIAGFLWWAFYERFEKYADCIGALTNSSCLTPDGGNVTSGGIFWGILALPFTLLAAVALCVVMFRLIRR